MYNKISNEFFSIIFALTSKCGSLITMISLFNLSPFLYCEIGDIAVNVISNVPGIEFFVHFY